LAAIAMAKVNPVITSALHEIMHEEEEGAGPGKKGKSASLFQPVGYCRALGIANSEELKQEYVFFGRNPKFRQFWP
jgi:hypothetical protein